MLPHHTTARGRKMRGGVEDSLITLFVGGNMPVPLEMYADVLRRGDEGVAVAAGGE